MLIAGVGSVRDGVEQLDEVKRELDDWLDQGRIED